MTATATAAAITRLGYRPALDGVRGAAVLLVVLGHYTDNAVPAAGAVGVSMFFVLSGFLITELLLEERARAGYVRLRTFYARRALRLFPAMAVFLAVVGTYAAVSEAVSAPVLYPALYVANLARAAGADLGLLGHTWSLSLEEQFYVVWPLALLLALRRGRRAAVAVAGVGIAASWASNVWVFLADDSAASVDRATFGPDTRSYALFLGCLVAILWPTLSRFGDLLAWSGLPAVVATLAVVTLPLGGGGPFFVLALPVAAVTSAVLVLHLVEVTSPLGRLAAWRPLVYCGRISYGLYLWHFAVYEALRNELPSLPHLARAALALPMSFAITMASFHLVELAFLDLKRRFRPAGDEHRAGTPATPLL